MPTGTAKTIARDWRELRDRAIYLLQKEVELQEIVQLVGPDALPDSEKAILEVTRMVREDFLQQSAYSDTDSFCPVEKQYLMLRAIMSYLRTGEPRDEPGCQPAADPGTPAQGGHREDEGGRGPGYDQGA